MEDGCRAAVGTLRNVSPNLGTETFEQLGASLPFSKPRLLRSKERWPGGHNILMVLLTRPHSIASGLDVTGPSYQRNDGQLRSTTADPRAAAHLERTSSTEYPFLDTSLTRPGDGVDAGRSASCHF